MGLSDTNVCDCEQGIEDVHYFLFGCTQYRAARKILLQTITSICDDAEQDWHGSFTHWVKPAG